MAERKEQPALARDELELEIDIHLCGGKPDGVKPDGGKPDGVKPDSVKPDGVKPDGVKPDGGKPDPGSARPLIPSTSFRPNVIGRDLRPGDYVTYRVKTGLLGSDCPDESDVFLDTVSMQMLYGPLYFPDSNPAKNYAAVWRLKPTGTLPLRKILENFITPDATLHLFSKGEPDIQYLTFRLGLGVPAKLSISVPTRDRVALIAHTERNNVEEEFYLVPRCSVREIFESPGSMCSACSSSGSAGDEPEPVPIQENSFVALRTNRAELKDVKVWTQSELCASSFLCATPIVDGPGECNPF